MNTDDMVMGLLCIWSCGCALWSMFLILASIKLERRKTQLYIDEHRWLERAARQQRVARWN